LCIEVFDAEEECAFCGLSSLVGRIKRGSVAEMKETGWRRSEAAAICGKSHAMRTGYM
jgi:hypothetical protein